FRVILTLQKLFALHTARHRETQHLAFQKHEFLVHRVKADDQLLDARVRQANLVHQVDHLFLAILIFLVFSFFWFLSLVQKVQALFLDLVHLFIGFLDLAECLEYLRRQLLFHRRKRQGIFILFLGLAALAAFLVLRALIIVIILAAGRHRHIGIAVGSA